MKAQTREMNYAALASQDSLARAVAGLRENGFEVFVVADAGEAKQKLLEIIPRGAEVMNMTSVTLDTISAAEAINNSDRFDSVRKKLTAMDPKAHALEKQRLGAAPTWAVGSVHAVTEDGKVMVASNTGSQLPAYAYGASRVVWVAGTHKIVPDIASGMRRIYEHALPLESERAKKAYGVPGSSVNKILIVNQEVQPGRITIILVKEVLGF